MKPKTPVINRMMNRTEQQGDCLLFTGATNNAGYGMINDGQKMRTVHRTLYEEIYGPVAPDKIVAHSCYNKTCLNHDHLYITDFATRQKEMCRDKRRKGSKGYKFPRVTCEHCGKEVPINTYGRWHKDGKCSKKDNPK